MVDLCKYSKFQQGIKKPKKSEYKEEEKSLGKETQGSRKQIEEKESHGGAETMKSCTKSKRKSTKEL